MSSVSPRAGGSDALLATELFKAPSYTEWARRTIRLRAGRRDATALFDSTISEPAQALGQVVRAAFGRQVTSRYVSAFDGGNPYAIKALAARYGVAKQQIIATTGTTASLQLVLKAFAGPGDHVLVERPGFDVVSSLAIATGARADPLDRKPPNFRLDTSDLRARLRPNTRAIVLTNLHNPSSVLLSPGELKDVAAVAAEVGAVVIVDEVYRDFAPDQGGATAAILADNIIAASSLTKVFGLFALKFGWIIAAPDIIARIRAKSPDGDTGVSKLTHAIAALVLEAPEPFEAHWRAILAANRPVLERHVAEMLRDGLIEGPLPAFGNMYFPRLVGIDDTLSFADRLWRRRRVIVAPGELYGLAGHIRIGFGGGSAELDRGLSQLHEFLLEEVRQGEAAAPSGAVSRRPTPRV